MKRKLLVFCATALLCCSVKTFAQYANTTLSNLTPSTQINADLNPLTDKGYNLGSPNFNWNNIYFRGKFFVQGVHAIQILKDNPNTYVGLNSGGNEFEGGVQDWDNTGIGYYNLTHMSVGSGNTAVGAFALTDGGWNYDHPVSMNTAIGAYALQHTQTSNNTGVGYGALNQNYSGERNTAVGIQALYNSLDSMNTAIGDHSLFSNVHGKRNTALGSQSLYTNSNGFENTAIGASTLFNNTLGQYNSAFGSSALFNNTSGVQNTAIGAYALYNNKTGAYNTAIGDHALFNTTASANIGIGFESLYNNVGGQQNISLGYWASRSLTSGNSNVTIGTQTAANNINGSYNVGIGWAALFNNGNSYNVGIGLQAGYHLTTQGTFLGTYADAVDNSFNVTAIGYGAQATADNQVKIGNPMVTSIGGYANWTNFSDGRYKQNIKENVPGLVFINQLKPVTYTLDIDGIENALTQKSGGANNSSLSKIQPSGTSSGEVNAVPARNQSPQDIQAKQQKEKVVYTGFVAQDVEKAAKAVNYDFSGVDVPKNKNDFYGLRYSDFVIPLVKAVQELSQKTDQIEELKKENEALAQKNDQLEQRLSKLENLLNVNSTSHNVTISSASISQNEPNPFNGGTRIRYYIPDNFSNARVDFMDILGKVIRSVSIKSSTGIITVDATILSSGTYQYTLVVDGRVIDTKRMAVSK